MAAMLPQLLEVLIVEGNPSLKEGLGSVSLQLPLGDQRRACTHTAGLTDTWKDLNYLPVPSLPRFPFVVRPSALPCPSLPSHVFLLWFQDS